MADVTIVKRKHHSGLDADKAGITGAIGETYGASDSGKLYYWNVSLSAWKTGLGYEFVEKLVESPPITEVDFTLDGNWHVNGLDLSGIIPAGVVAVKIKMYLSDDAANSYLILRRDAVKDENTINGNIKVANIDDYKVEDISIESDRLLDYKASAVVFTAIQISVLGWYI